MMHYTGYTRRWQDDANDFELEHPVAMAMIAGAAIGILFGAFVALSFLL